MEEKRQLLTEYINGRLEKLESLGKTYSKEKIDKLINSLLKTNKELPDLYILIDNKFSSQARKISHNNHLANLPSVYGNFLFVFTFFIKVHSDKIAVNRERQHFNSIWPWRTNM